MLKRSIDYFTIGDLVSNPTSGEDLLQYRDAAIPVFPNSYGIIDATSCVAVAQSGESLCNIISGKSSSLRPVRRTVQKQILEAPQTPHVSECKVRANDELTVQYGFNPMSCVFHFGPGSDVLCADSEGVYKKVLITEAMEASIKRTFYDECPLPE
jgi:hypothetical protein